MAEIRGLLYYEKDGALRAYANRVLILAVVLGFAVVVLGAIVFASRVKPPTIIRIGPDGQTTVISPEGQPHSGAPPATLQQIKTSEAPTDLEKKSYVMNFVKLYWGYDEHTLTQNWANAMNMMTRNLEQNVLSKLQSDNTVGRLQEAHTRSVVTITSAEADSADPLVYHVLGTRTTSSIGDGRENAQKMAESYTIRLVETDRTVNDPSGLLIADFKIEQISSDSNVHAGQ